jgi:hypothetical protein
MTQMGYFILNNRDVYMSKIPKISDLENPCATQLVGINEYDIVNRVKNKRLTMSHFHLNQHIKALKESIAYLSGNDGASIEIVLDKQTYETLKEEYMIDRESEEFIIHGIQFKGN